MKIWSWAAVVVGVGAFLVWNLWGFSGPAGKEEPQGATSSPPRAPRGPAGKEEGKAPASRPSSRPVPPSASRPASRPGRKKALSVLLKELAAKGVHLDLKRKLLWVEGKTWILNANLEYVAVGPRGATHETLLVLDCKASALNAALLALGLKPGRNYSLKEKIPPPPKEDVLSGKTKPYVLIHPEGPGVILTVEWRGKDGKPLRYRVEDLVLDLTTKKPLARRRWIYFGGRWAPLYKGEPPVYVADYEENLISVCYMDPSNHLITIRHEHGLDDTRWWPNFRLLPPKGTPIKFYISLEPLPGTNPPPPSPKEPKGDKKD